MSSSRAKKNEPPTHSGSSLYSSCLEFGPGCQPLFDVHAALPLNVASIAVAADVCWRASRRALARSGDMRRRSARGNIGPDEEWGGQSAASIPRAAAAQTRGGHPLAGDSASPGMGELLVGRRRTGHRVPGSGPRRGPALAGAAYRDGWADSWTRRSTSTTRRTWTRSCVPTRASRRLADAQSLEHGELAGGARAHLSSPSASSRS